MQALLLLTFLIGPSLCFNEDFYRQLDVTEDYNRGVMPTGEDGQKLVITGSINIRNILEVDEVNQKVALETTLRFYWKDSRIRFNETEINKPVYSVLPDDTMCSNYTNINQQFADKIWMPDIFIDQSIELHTPTYYSKPATLRVYQDSTIWYSARINFEVACKMTFYHYPHDVQVCYIKFESFGYTIPQLQMKWKLGGLDINHNITLAQFEHSIQLDDEYKTDYYAQEFVGLGLKITLKRRFGYHVIETYIPSALLVALAWMSLFIPIEFVPGRVTMVMTSLLTTVSKFSSVRQNVPKVSYISYLDVWMLVSLLFVFSCVCEFIIVLVVYKNVNKIQTDALEARIKKAVPVLFILFVCVYWPIILWF